MLLDAAKPFYAFGTLLLMPYRATVVSLGDKIAWRCFTPVTLK
jgi:hypothetical protein